MSRDKQENDGNDPDQRWAQAASDLRDYREAQRARWGGVDEMTVSRFVAGSITAEERERVRLAMPHEPGAAGVDRSCPGCSRRGSIGRGTRRFEREPPSTPLPSRAVPLRAAAKAAKSLHDRRRQLSVAARDYPVPETAAIPPGSPTRLPRPWAARPPAPGRCHDHCGDHLGSCHDPSFRFFNRLRMPPAVPSASTTSSRSALACHNYESAHGSFPMGNRAYAFSSPGSCHVRVPSISDIRHSFSYCRTLKGYGLQRLQSYSPLVQRHQCHGGPRPK